MCGVVIMFSIIRFIFFIIIFLIGLFILKKSSLVHKKKFRVVLIVICVIFTTILSLFPIENVFVTFSTPEAAFEYFHSCPAIFIVNGEKTDLVIGEKDSAYVYRIIPKSNKRWKIGNSFDTKMKFRKIVGEVAIYGHQYKNSEELYIEVSHRYGKALEISDSKQSKFLYLIDKDVKIKSVYTYYAYIGDADENYYICIGDEKIYLFDKQ